MTTLATDIGGTKLVATPIGAGGQTRDRRELPTPASQTLGALRDALSILVSPLQAHTQRVTTASTGITRDDSLLALNPYNPSGLLHFPLVKTLEQLANLSIIAVSDAQAVARAEHQALGGDVAEMVFIIISTGVDGGVVNDGKLLAGSDGLARYIGHTLTDPHSPVCGCGCTGCAEAIAFGRDIAAAVRNELTGAGARTIFIHAGQGDEQAQQLIHHSARTLTRPIADIKAVTNCQCVVVGGSVGLTEGYLVLVGTYLMQEPAAFHVDLLAVYYRHDAGLLGAALLTQGKKL